MRPHLEDPPIFNNKDTIGVLDRREPVGNDEAGTLARESVHAALDERFGKCVDRARRFVHDEDLGFSQHGAGEADQLLLPNGEEHSAFADFSFVFLFQLVDECTRLQLSWQPR